MTGLFCTLLFCWRLATQWQDRGKLMLAAAGTAVAFFGVHLALWGLTGFDAWATFNRALTNDGLVMDGINHKSPLQHAQIALANLVVFLLTVGLGATVVWGRRLCDWNVWVRGTSLDRLSATFAVTLVIVAVAPLYTLEVERIWMFLVPCVVIPVAQVLRDEHQESGDWQLWRTVATLLAVQTVTTEMLLTTYW